ncbi:MAG: hypothetical protein WDN45_18315 [Caulobacteraceae bacterium]
MAERKWIKGATKHKGGPPRSPACAQGREDSRRQAARREKKGGKVGKEARLAENLSHLNHKH